MARLLVLKMLRDIKRSGVAYITAILIVAIGFCGYCVLSIAYDQLAQSRETFYEQTGYPNVFAQVKQAPLGIARRIEQIPGVSRAEGRLTTTVRVENLRSETEVELKLISQYENGMSKPVLSKGFLPQQDKKELVVGDNFFLAHSLSLGATVDLVFGRQKIPLQICGSGLSPENIYMIKNITDMLPDNAVYDMGFISYNTLSSLMGIKGFANEFLICLNEGVELEDVKEDIEKTLSPYGCYAVFDRNDHISTGMLNTELTQLQKVTTAIPMLFLVVACVILYITLNRLIQQQRTQAGTLVALGIPQKQVCIHYLVYGSFVGFIGGFVGGLAGSLLAGPMTDFYRLYFSLPEISFAISWKYLFIGSIAAGLFCSIVGWACAHSLLKLNPSESLRPPAPKSYKISLLEKIPQFTKIFTVPGLMAVRSLSRNTKRTIISLFGIACAYMITATLVSMNSLFDVFLFDFLEKTQQQDITVNFTQPVLKADAIQSVRTQELEYAEGIFELPAKLIGPMAGVECTVQGIEQDSQLCYLFDNLGNAIRVEPFGIVISEHIAKQMGVSVGDIIRVKVSYPNEKITSVPITGVVAQYMGTTAYMSLQGIERISEYHDAVTSLLIKAPQNIQELLVKKLKDAANVATVDNRVQRAEKMRTMMGSFGGIMTAMAAMGVIIGLAVIYTSSLISFEELKREISTMMMLGLSSKQCLEVISVGQWLLTVGAIFVGVPMTMAVSKMLSTAMASDLYTIPDFVDARSLVFAVLLTFGAVAISCSLMLKKLRKITPVELLRERE